MYFSCLAVSTLSGWACYLQWGLGQKRSLPETRDRVLCCLYIVPAGGVGGPTESNGRPTSAQAQPAGSSSACPTPRQHWPCCLWSEKHRYTLKAALSLQSITAKVTLKLMFMTKMGNVFTYNTVLLGSHLRYRWKAVTSYRFWWLNSDCLSWMPK